MLGKLTKHELIASGRMIIPMYIALVFTTFFGKLFIWLSSKEVFLESVPLTFAKIVRSISSLFTILYILLIIVVMVATVLFIAIRFYKNFYTDEGYLMFTLPVNSKSLITSKLISAFLWTILSSAIVLGSLFLIMNTEETRSSFKLLWEEFILMLKRMAPEMNIPFWLLVTEIIALIVIAMLGQYLMVYTSIAAGPTFSSKSKIVGSIIAYVIINILGQIVSFIMMYVLSTIMPNYIDALNQNAGQAVQYTIVSTTGLNVIFCVVFFFVTDHLMKTKTNLD